MNLKTKVSASLSLGTLVNEAARSVNDELLNRLIAQGRKLLVGNVLVTPPWAKVDGVC
jgi:hypothetical protein